MAMRYAGLALMVGVLLSFLVPLLVPGYTLINPVDQTDFRAARDALGEMPVLAQWTTFFTLISLVLMIFGFVGLWPLASRQGGMGGKLLQFGIIATIIEWSILFLSQGVKHFEIHLMQRSSMEAEGSAMAAELENAALALHMDVTGVSLAFVALAPIASSMFGLGLAQRFASMDLLKAACYVLPLGGAIGLLNFLFAMNAPGVGIQSLLLVNTLVLYVQGVCLIIVGLGMFQERMELSEEAF